MSYMTISSQEKHNFSLCSCFHAHPTTLLLKILGGPMHGRSPHLKFWGAVPPSPPLGLRPWYKVTLQISVFTILFLRHLFNPPLSNSLLLEKASLPIVSHSLDFSLASGIIRDHAS